MVWPESPYEDSLLSRYEDPGAGSYSYHRGRVFQATRNVQGERNLPTAAMQHISDEPSAKYHGPSALDLTMLNELIATVFFHFCSWFRAFLILWLLWR